jgi:integrase
MTGGHIRQRSPGSWEIRYRVAGKYRTETVHGGKRDAQRRLRELLTLADQGRHPDDPNRLTVAGWLDKWLDIVKPELAVQTHLGYATAVRVHLAPAFDGVLLSRMSPSHVQDFYSRLAASELQASTARRISTILGAALNRAVELRLIATSPAAAISKRQPRPPVSDAPPVLDRQQCEALLAGAHDSDIYIAVLLGLATGMRRGEILALRWRDVDFAGGLIRVEASVFQLSGQTGRKAPKSGEARIVTIASEVVAELRRVKAEQAEQLLRAPGCAADRRDGDLPAWRRRGYADTTSAIRHLRALGQAVRDAGSQFPRSAAFPRQRATASRCPGSRRRREAGAPGRRRAVAQDLCSRDRRRGARCCRPHWRLVSKIVAIQ